MQHFLLKKYKIYISVKLTHYLPSHNLYIFNYIQFNFFLLDNQVKCNVIIIYICFKKYFFKVHLKNNNNDTLKMLHKFQRIIFSYFNFYWVFFFFVFF